MTSLAARADLRGTAQYEEVHAFYREMYKPGLAAFTDIADLYAASSGKEAVFTGMFFDSLDGNRGSRICQVDLNSRRAQILTFGACSDHTPKLSPDDQRVAFISDRVKGQSAVYLLDREHAAIHRVPEVDGWVEYFHWSPTGTHILMGVAGHGADLAGAHGGMSTPRLHQEGIPRWMPVVDAGAEAFHWRSVWVYDMGENRVHCVSPSGLNVWEATWCGPEAIAIVSSAAPGESSWYRSVVQVLRLRDSKPTVIYQPPQQVGVLAAAPSGRWVAFVQAICSDRAMVAGDLHLLDTADSSVRRINTDGMDVTCVEWRREEGFAICGQRGLETVVGFGDIARGFAEIWSSTTRTTPGICATVSTGDLDACWLITESFFDPPEIARVRKGHYETVLRPSCGKSQATQRVRQAKPIAWNARDGLEIQGWLLTQAGSEPPWPVILWIHGGPVWQWRPTWLVRRSAWVELMLDRGFAILLPNPRGSSGRGQDFARHILGDMGGADAGDLVAGIDHLVDEGIANPQRLGVVGASYGGYMSTWLTIHDQRFSAAVAIAPVNNYVTEHLTSNIADWVRRFLQDSYRDLGGKYYSRSSITYAHQVRTPTLSICGALDRSAPPEQAIQFHNALLENGVESLLVTYPLEGHGIRQFPALIDFAARVVAWFEEHV